MFRVETFKFVMRFYNSLVVLVGLNVFMENFFTTSSIPWHDIIAEPIGMAVCIICTGEDGSTTRTKWHVHQIGGETTSSVTRDYPLLS